MDVVQTKPHFSIPSLIAIGCAIASYFVGAVGGFILALIAIAFGIVGLFVAMSPSVRGGLISMLALFLAGIAIVVAVIKAIVWAV